MRENSNWMSLISLLREQTTPKKLPPQKFATKDLKQKSTTPKICHPKKICHPGNLALKPQTQ